MKVGGGGGQEGGGGGGGGGACETRRVMNGQISEWKAGESLDMAKKMWIERLDWRYMSEGKEAAAVAAIAVAFADCKWSG